MNTIAITDKEFSQFQRFIHEAAGINLSPAKKALVSGRLARRLQHFRVGSYSEYFKLLSEGQAPAEAQVAVDLLTTNETYFFREPKHFEFLRECALASQGSGTFRVWSAACSTGEEPYSIAMVLADCLGGRRPWEVVGSDISTRVLHSARTGHYTMERARHVPQEYLRRYCLRGVDEQTGTLLVERGLRQKVSFMQLNLIAPLPAIGSFDFIFLRNVMIYFSGDTKREVVARVLSALKPGGYFCIGHSESLHEVNDTVKQVMPSVYRKP